MGENFSSVTNDIINSLPKHVYISFDIDSLDPSFCPSTGTPVPGGLDYQEAVFIIEAIKESGREIISFDLCEVSPSLIPGSEYDQNVGARILYKMSVCSLK